MLDTFTLTLLSWWNMALLNNWLLFKEDEPSSWLDQQNSSDICWFIRWSESVTDNITFYLFKWLFLLFTALEMLDNPAFVALNVKWPNQIFVWDLFNIIDTKV